MTSPLRLYHILSVGGGGMFTARVPDSSRTSTVRSNGVFETSAIFFLMYSFSVAFWKYLDLAILSTKRRIFLPVLPPAWLYGHRHHNKCKQLCQHVCSTCPIHFQLSLVVKQTRALSQTTPSASGMLRNQQEVKWIITRLRLGGCLYLPEFPGARLA